MSKLTRSPEYRREYRKTHREYFAQKGKEWRQKNRKQFQSNYTFQKFKHKNNIIPEPCVLCFSEQSEAHHPDYSHPLLVVWLCKVCHEWAHSAGMSFSKLAVNYAK